MNNGCNDKTFEGISQTSKLFISNSFIDHCSIHGAISHEEKNISTVYFEYKLSINKVDFIYSVLQKCISSKIMHAAYKYKNLSDILIHILEQTCLFMEYLF